MKTRNKDVEVYPIRWLYLLKGVDFIICKHLKNQVAMINMTVIRIKTSICLA